MVLVTACLLAASQILKMGRGQIFLLSVFFYNVRTSCGLMVESLHFLAEKLFGSQSERLEDIYLSSTLSVVSLLLAHVLLLTVLLWFLGRQMQKKQLVVRGWELCYLTLIPVAGILFGQLIASLLFEVHEGMLLQLYERHPEFVALVPVLAVMFYAGTFLTVVFWQRTECLREEQRAGFVEFQQVRVIQERLGEVERFYDEIRRMRHEIRGHLTNLQGLARSGHYEEMEQYLARIGDSMETLETAFQTGNPVIDVIVGDKEQQAKGLGARFQVDFHYPKSGNYDAFDMGIILHNLLQNALEACEKVEAGKRYVKLTGRKRGRFFLIEVCNSFAGRIAFSADGLPVTTKADASMHGIGLSNVRREVEKYMGEMELKMENQEFCATILLQERGMEI